MFLEYIGMMLEVEEKSKEKEQIINKKLYNTLKSGGFVEIQEICNYVMKTGKPFILNDKPKDKVEFEESYNKKEKCYKVSYLYSGKGKDGESIERIKYYKDCAIISFLIYNSKINKETRIELPILSISLNLFACQKTVCYKGKNIKYLKLKKIRNDCFFIVF